MSERIEDILRRVRGRVIAALVRAAGGIDAAEDAFQEAALAAIATWPERGVPDEPAAWLTTAGKNYALDRRRRRAVAADKAPMLKEPEAMLMENVDTVSDAQLRLLFTCCHPALPRESQVALTLKVIAGLTTDQIARAFLCPEPTMAQRIVRAKRTIEDDGVPYEVPERSELPARLQSVLAVVYLIYNEGHTGSEGALMRLDMQAEALTLGRLLADLMPNDSEVFGLLALMTLGVARSETRTDATGRLLLLSEQDRGRWRSPLVEEGLLALARARRLGGIGPYTLQAEIAACHVAAPTWESTDWRAILAAYDALLALTRSPVVAMNRAVAVCMVHGPDEALGALDPLEQALSRYHLFFATRADFLRRLGRDARPDYERALALATNDAERAFLREQLAGATEAN